MHEGEEHGEIPVAAGQALARLLSRENRVSDFIAFLAALDPEPFLAALGLPAQQVQVKREDPLDRRSSGRADLVIRGAGGPVALLEIKVSAAQHGDQFNSYDRWAKDQVQPPTCYLVALDGEALNPPEDWKVKPALPELLRCWKDSRNPHAAWLAASVATVLEGWGTQADGKLGNAAGPIVGDLIARRIAAGLVADGIPRRDLKASATRTRVGVATALASLPFPGQSKEHGPWLRADLRSTVRDRPGAPWELRLGVEVEINGQVSPAQARVRAHKMAMSIRGTLTCTAVKRALRGASQTGLADALSARRSSRDDLETADEGTRSEWRAHVEESPKGHHPRLVHDNIKSKKYQGYRLASLIEVNVTDLDWRQLATLVQTALAHIKAHAS